MDDKYKIVDEHYRKNAAKLKTTVCKYSKRPMSVSEDIVHSAYTSAMTYIDSYDSSKGPFERWFSHIIFNTMRQYFNSHKKHDNASRNGFSFDTFKDDGWHSLPDELTFYPSEISEVKAEFIRSIEAAPEHKKLILSLYYLEGFTSLNISQMTGYTHDNTRKIISEFNKKLRQQ